MTRMLLLGIGVALAVQSSPLGAESEGQLKVRISWGNQSPLGGPFYLKLATNDVALLGLRPVGFESDDRFENGVSSTQAGAGDVDGVEFALRFPERSVNAITNLHRIWADLLAQSDPDTVQRLRQDPAYRPDSRRITLQMDGEGTKGFSLTVDQLLRQKAFWIPSLDVYVAAGEPLLAFSEHQRQLRPFQGKRILDQVHNDSEATCESFAARWEDMGNPGYKNPGQTGPGHIIGITWDSALHKFGIDRGAGIWNDYGNPDRFRSWLEIGDLAQDLRESWKGQRLSNGLPVITTVFEREGVRYQIEQFAYPLNGPPTERRGDISMVLLEKLTLTDLTGRPNPTSLKMRHRRLLPESAAFRERRDPNLFVLEEGATGGVLLSIQGVGQVGSRELPEPKPAKPEKPNFAWKQTELVLSMQLDANASREFVVKLPSPILSPEERDTLLHLDYTTALAATTKFWSDYLDQGAQFRVPEPAVNELFRANLWHALRLPRRHGGQGPAVKIDLPYSNFAYDQRGTPWPVNQAVYVDYMIYDLRGYSDISAEELRAIYRNNQETNGHVGGYANWVVYTPGMIYSVAKNYLLSGDQTRFNELLPPTLKALDWCLSEIKKSQQRSGPASGLVAGPLNDLTGDGFWAFNQAYIFAGLDLLGKALTRLGHPRAGECVAAARAFRQSVARGFAAATTLSPLVQLRDHTWTPYVPCEVLSPHRLYQQWYPTDIDTGATHLPRLNALDPQGLLSEYLLQDHEDNLYLHGWGMANEPVYNQQATAYLLRDDPKAAIRAFYSMMACAFSQSVFEPVEHRWTWGQYFGPPSTDGAWFELYRQMLIQERDDDTLLLLQATPRQWLADGKTIHIERAPTYYGHLSLTVQSQAASGRLLADLDVPERSRPKVLLLRFRHPESRQLRSVTVNGQNWSDIDKAQEWVRISAPGERHYKIIAEY